MFVHARVCHSLYVHWPNCSALIKDTLKSEAKCCRTAYAVEAMLPWKNTYIWRANHSRTFKLLIDLNNINGEFGVDVG